MPIGNNVEGAPQGDYSGQARARYELRTDVAQEDSVMRDLINDKNDELEAAALARQEEEESKGFWGWLTTMGTTIGCMALGPVSAAACLAAGAAVGGATRLGVDLFTHSEDIMPEGIDTSGAKFHKSAWAEVEDDVEAQLTALEDFDDNVWKQDILKQASDTWSSAKWGTGLKSAGFIDDVPGIKMPSFSNLLKSYIPDLGLDDEPK